MPGLEKKGKWAGWQVVGATAGRDYIATRGENSRMQFQVLIRPIELLQDEAEAFPDPLQFFEVTSLRLI